MYEKSFDGEFRAVGLMSRIAAEDRVGDSLSADTIRLYSRKMQHASNRINGGDLNNLSPEDLVRDIVERINNKLITQSSARIEKASALFWIAEKAQSLLDNGSADLERYDYAYRDIQELTTKSLQKRSQNTSGQKLKAFPDEAVSILEKAALTNKSKALRNALLFIKANLILGLRPVEWFNSKLIEYHNRDALGDYLTDEDGNKIKSLALEVKNAKHSSVRANGEKRVILLDKLTEIQISYIKRWLKLVSELKSENLVNFSEAEVNKKIYSPLQRSIKCIFLKSGWDGASPALYSTRHQAVANAKANGNSQREIAALFGHSSLNTASKHYGKKYSGYSGRTMTPAPESVLAVRLSATSPVDPSPWIEAPVIGNPNNR